MKEKDLEEITKEKLKNSYHIQRKVYEMEDMILVNGYLKELKPYNSNNINLDVIFMALNESIFDYINCIKAEGDYSSEFGDDYVQITEEQEEDDE